MRTASEISVDTSKTPWDRWLLKMSHLGKKDTGMKH